MSVPVRLGAFVAVLVVAFAAAFGVGAAVGPLDDGTGTTNSDTNDTGAEMRMDHGSMDEGGG